MGYIFRHVTFVFQYILSGGNSFIKPPTWEKLTITTELIKTEHYGQHHNYHHKILTQKGHFEKKILDHYRAMGSFFKHVTFVFQYI